MINLERNYYPLSIAQKALNYFQMKTPNTPMLNLVYTLKFSIESNPANIKKAIHILLQRNDGLRIKLINSNGELMQYVSEYRDFSIDFYKFESLDELNRWVESEARRSFELIEKELYYFAILELSNEEYMVFIKLNHLISDGWSTFLIASQVYDYYASLDNNKVLERDKMPSYVEYIVNEMNYIDSQKYIKDKNLWYEKLDGYNGTALVQEPTGGMISAKIGIDSVNLPDELAVGVKALCKSLNTYPVILFTAIMQIYTYLKTAEKDFVITFLFHNRTNKYQEDTVGVFVIGIPLRVVLNEDMEIKSLIKKVFSELKFALKNGRGYAYEEFSRFVKEMTALRTITIANDKFEYSKDGITDLIKFYSSGYTPVPLIFRIVEEKNACVALEYEYQTDIFTEEDIKEMHDGIQSILYSLIKEPEKKLSELQIFGEIIS